MTHHDTTLPAILRGLAEAETPILTKDAGDPFDVLSKRVTDLADVTLKRVAETEAQVEGVMAEVMSVHQKMARIPGGVEPAAETWGAEFVRQGGDRIKALAEDRTIGRVSLNLKAAITTGPTSAGGLEVPARDATVLLPQRRLTIRDLLPVVSISTGSVEYVQQDARPTGAAAVAEGALKPESAMGFSLRTTSAKVIAHWIPISRQALEDLPQLRDLIDTEMRYGLALAEEAQILYGDGTGANLDGLIPNATAFVAPYALTSPTMLDTLGAAMLQAALNDFPPDGIVLHPSDWLRIRLLKDADGDYLFGDPQSSVELRLWGLPVVPTKSMAVGSFLVAAFASAATLYDRWAPRLEIAYVGNQFIMNMVTALVEERVGLAVKQPKALIFGSFGNP